MNLADLRYTRFNSSVARRALSVFYHPGRYYRLRFGPLRGLRLRYDVSINFHAILGLWEAETFEILDRVFVKSGALARDSTVADLGGNIGYFALWFALVVADAGWVYTFEPNPEILRVLSDNVKINGIDNVQVVNAACADHVGSTEFFIASHHHSSSLHEVWAGAGQQNARKISVACTTVDAFFAPETGRRAPNFLKVDIEGGATFAFQGCRRTFAETRPYVLVESHMPDEDRAISDVLCEFDYRAYRLTDHRWVTKPTLTHPDKEGVWGTLLLIPAEHVPAIAGHLGGMPM